MQDYLAIPAVSAGLLRELLERCPRAAWYQSWLNPNPPPADDTKETDRGTVAHAILLEGNTNAVAVIDPLDHPAEKTGNIPDGWTNKSIRQARDVARLSGKIPILKGSMAEIDSMVKAAQTFISSLKDSEPKVWEAFSQGQGASEVTETWLDNTTPCKIRPDRVSNDKRLIVDYKSTATSAHPDAWGRSQLIGSGYYLSASFYRRGFRVLFGIDPDYVFLVQSVDAPYLCSLVGCEPALVDLGARQVQAALTVWGQCVRDNHWPAYPSRIAYPETPGWLLADWQDKEVDDIWTTGLGSQP
jgi:hypothetical protein